MYEIRCNMAGRSNVDAGFITKIGSCVDGNRSLTLDAPGLAAAFIMTVRLGDADMGSAMRRY